MNNKTLVNKYLSRRNFIKGLAGAGLLSSLQVEKVFAETRAPIRVCFIPISHGWGSGNKAVDEFVGSEYDFKLPNFWTPFESIREHCVFIDGLRGTFWGNAHDVSYSDILTASVPINAPKAPELGSEVFRNPIGPSIDYLLEKHYKMPALRLSAGYRSWGAAHHPLSFNERLENLAYYRNAYTAYESLFKNTNPTGSTGTLDPVIAELFPYLSDETNNVIQSIDIKNEKNKLLSYLESVNSVNTKLNKPITSGTATLTNIPVRDQNLGIEIDSMLDMVRVAFTNDTHRVAVVGIGEYTAEFKWTDSAGRNYTGITGYTGDFHHEIAHYSENKPFDAQLAYAAWTRYNVTKIVTFVNNLKNTVDVDGRSLLDNTIIVLTGEVGNGSHDTARKSHVVIGGNNIIRGNRWYKLPIVSATSVGSRDVSGAYQSIKDTSRWFNEVSARSHADLYTRIAQITGLNLPTFGIDVLNNGPLDI